MGGRLDFAKDKRNQAIKQQGSLHHLTDFSETRKPKKRRRRRRSSIAQNKKKASRPEHWSGEKVPVTKANIPYIQELLLEAMDHFVNQRDPNILRDVVMKVPKSKNRDGAIKYILIFLPSLCWNESTHAFRLNKKHSFNEILYSKAKDYCWKEYVD